jgi:hypothetical protein
MTIVRLEIAGEIDQHPNILGVPVEEARHLVDRVGPSFGVAAGGSSPARGPLLFHDAHATFALH